MNELNTTVNPRLTPNCPGCSELRNLINSDSGSFSKLVYGAIFANILVLAMDGYNNTPFIDEFCQACDYGFTAFFIVELFLKVLTLGPIGYFSDGYNRFDFVLVTISVVDLAVQMANFASALRVARMFRMARVIRLASIARMSRGKVDRSPKMSISRIFSIVGLTAPWLTMVYMLLFLMLFVFSILGMQFFGGTFEFEGEERPLFHFDNFGMAFITLFTLLIGGDWQIVVQDATRATGGLAASFFALWILLARWFLLSMVVAVLLDRIDHDAHEVVLYSAKGTMRSVYFIEKAVMDWWVGHMFRKWKNTLMASEGGDAEGDDSQGNIGSTGKGKLV
jgi:voltage-dependent calcium channel T type alpha-1G